MKKDTNSILKMRLAIFNFYKKYYKKTRNFCKVDFKWSKAINRYSRINDDIYAKMKTKYETIRIVEKYFGEGFAREWMVISPLGTIVLFWLWLDFSKSKRDMAKMLGKKDKVVLENKLRANAVIIMAFLTPFSSFLAMIPKAHEKIASYLRGKYITVSS